MPKKSKIFTILLLSALVIPPAQASLVDDTMITKTEMVWSYDPIQDAVNTSTGEPFGAGSEPVDMVTFYWDKIGLNTIDIRMGFNAPVRLLHETFDYVEVRIFLFENGFGPDQPTTSVWVLSHIILPSTNRTDLYELQWPEFVDQDPVEGWVNPNSALAIATRVDTSAVITTYDPTQIRTDTINFGAFPTQADILEISAYCAAGSSADGDDIECFDRWWNESAVLYNPLDYRIISDPLWASIELEPAPEPIPDHLNQGEGCEEGDCSIPEETNWSIEKLLEEAVDNPPFGSTLVLFSLLVIAGTTLVILVAQLFSDEKTSKKSWFN